MTSIASSPASTSNTTPQTTSDKRSLAKDWLLLPPDIQTKILPEYAQEDVKILEDAKMLASSGSPQEQIKNLLRFIAENSIAYPSRILETLIPYQDRAPSQLFFSEPLVRQHNQCYTFERMKWLGEALTIAHSYDVQQAPAQELKDLVHALNDTKKRSILLFIESMSPVPSQVLVAYKLLRKHYRDILANNGLNGNNGFGHLLMNATHPTKQKEILKVIPEMVKLDTYGWYREKCAKLLGNVMKCIYNPKIFGDALSTLFKQNNSFQKWHTPNVLQEALKDSLFQPMKLSAIPLTNEELV